MVIKLASYDVLFIATWTRFTYML